MTTGEHMASRATALDFEARVVDGIPRLLEQTYRLRYQVYCRERKFLNADDYPLGLEIDEYDAFSVHIGAIDRNGELAGTARVVMSGPLGLPLFRYCTLFTADAELYRPGQVVEVSRLSVSRSYKRRTGDDGYGCREPLDRSALADRRRLDGQVLLTLLKGVYHVSRHLGATHWLAATEKSLLRILTRYGFPSRRIGPESDYFGLVAPSAMDLQEFERVIASRAFPLLEEFAWRPQPALWPGDHGLAVVNTHAQPLAIEPAASLAATVTSSNRAKQAPLAP
jgi:N-acyl amino acid synthase of PEP-CTERM/exosortase system